MALQRKFHVILENYFGEAAAIEAKLLKLTSDVIDERDSLREKVKSLQRELDAAVAGPSHSHVEPHELSILAHSNGESVALDNSAAIDRFDIEVRRKTSEKRRELLMEMDGIRLSDDEMMKLAVLARLTTEVEMRQEDTKKGYFFHLISIIFFLELFLNIYFLSFN